MAESDFLQNANKNIDFTDYIIEVGEPGLK